MRRLFLIASFSIANALFAAQYPYLTDLDSLVKQECERNARACFVDQDVEITQACESLHVLPHFLAKEVNARRFTTKGESLAFEKRQYLYDIMMKNGYEKTIDVRRDVLTILQKLQLSEEAREKEQDAVQDYIINEAAKLCGASI